MKIHSLKKLATAGVIIILTLSAAVSGNAAEVDLNPVLVLHSYHRGLGWTDSIARGIDETFQASPFSIETYTEYMDTKRIFDEKYLGDLAALLAYKYRNRKFAVIISSDDHAFRFLRRHQKDIFTGTPVVFCGVNYFRDELITAHPEFTGVVEAFSIKETIDAALTVNPNLRRVYSVVDKTVTGSANLKLLEDVIPEFRTRLEFITVTDKDMNEVVTEVSQLPADSIVLLLAFTSDKSGNTFSLEQSADIITAACNQPVYSFWDFHLNHGVIGGMLTTGISQGTTAAKLALRIIDGENPAAIRVLKTSPNRYIFDYTVMKRFGISMENLPPGSDVINRPESFYQQYKRIVWQTLLAFGALLMFIFIISLNLVRRKRVEKRLKASEDKFRSLVETTSDWIWEVDRNGRYTYVSPKVTDLLGYTPEEVLGKTPFDFMPPEEAERVRQEFAESVDKREPLVQLPNVNRRKDGREVTLETTGIPVFGPNNEFIGYRGIDRDITERRQAETALRESEARFRDLAELLPEAVFEIDLNGNVRYANKSAFRQFLLDPTVAGSEFNIADLIATGDQEKLKRNIARILRGEDLGLNEYTAVRNDGTRFPVMARSSVILKDGNPAGLRGFLIDISEMKNLEEAFHLAQRMESVGTLAGGVAHDFNNLLMGIQGRVSLLAFELGPNHPLREHIDSIEDHIKSAANLTGQLLGFARGGKYEVKPLEISQHLSSIAAMFARTHKEVHFHTRTSLTPLVVEGDKRQIEQVLLNIFINAWQAMPQGGDIYLETKAVTLSETDCEPHQCEPGRYVRVSVTDTGIGMDGKTLTRIFDPFFTTKEKQRGTGLGLASAFGIVRNHGGVITAESEVGRGSTFNIYLPISDRAFEYTATPAKKMVAGSETVLLVDDETIVADVGKAMLEKLGYRVLISKSGREALDAVNEHGDAIDLVILDLVMPGMDGGKVFDKIREIRPQMPVILSSGYAVDGQANEIMKRGCNAFIQKPFDISEMSRQVRKILDETRR